MIKDTRLTDAPADSSAPVRTVLLVNPNQMKPAVAPLALDYLASALRKKFRVDLLDLCFSADPCQAIEDYFAHGSADNIVAIGVTLRNTDDTYFASQDFFLPRFKEVTDCLKKCTPAPLVLGGSGFSVMPEAVLDYCNVDLGIWGEGEYSLPLLVTRIATGENWEDVPGLVYRSRIGYRRTPSQYSDLSRLPPPHRDLVDNRRYFSEGGMGNLETKRGCPKNCLYCADPIGKGRQIRLRSPQSVAKEMALLLEMGIDHFHLCDSEFNLPDSHALAVCSQIIQTGLGDRVRWYIYASPVPFSDELATLMQRAGCAGINFGVDSGVDYMLRNLGRDYTVEEIEQTAKICHRQGLVFMYDLLLGGPGETRESLRQTIETMKRLSPHRIGASLGVRVFPYTRLATLVRKQGHLVQNPNLRGTVHRNNNFFAPVFYLSHALGEGASEYLTQLIGKDERFFIGTKTDIDRNYNYNDNSVLVNAIRKGYRGAFWDILRRIAEEAQVDTLHPE